MKHKMQHYCYADMNISDRCMCRTIKPCSSSPTKVFKCCCIFVGIVIVLEVLIANILLLYGIMIIHSTINPVLQKEGNIVDKLGESWLARTLVMHGKNGGFASLIQNTIERLYFDYTTSPAHGFDGVGVASLGIDVSDSGEALYIYRHLLQKKSFPYTKLVVDIGANDGLMSSNSFNFIQWGWDAILVEPQFDQISMARKNIYR